MIAAGLDGIERGLEAGEPINQDIYEMSVAERQAHNLAILPQNLGAAATALAADTVLSSALGQEFVNEFVRLKQAEWAEYSQQVSAWELQRYLDRF